MKQHFLSFLHQTRFEDLPRDHIEKAKLWLLDILGVAASGTQTKLSKTINDHAINFFGSGQKTARIFYSEAHASAVGAALANGCTIDSIDAHDGHKITKGHTGCGLIPSVFAFSDCEGLTCDQEFLTQIVLGYEIGTRAGIALHATASDYHTSGAWISLAAASIGARALGLNEVETRHAIGIAEYHGPRSQMMRVIDHPTMLKDGSGWGAMAGVSAAYLAQSGFTGAPAISVESDEVEEFWSDLGQRWRIQEQYFKHFPICRWAQPAVQAVLDLRCKHDLKSEDVLNLEIETFHESLRLATRNPTTTEEAQYSTAYPAAVALVHGRVTPNEVTEECFENQEIKRIADTMIITENNKFNQAFPARRISKVIINLRSGEKLISAETEALGDPENPTMSSEIQSKFYSYTAPVLGVTRTREVESAVLNLGNGKGLSDLFDAIYAA